MDGFKLDIDAPEWTPRSGFSQRGKRAMAAEQKLVRNHRMHTAATKVIATGCFRRSGVARAARASKARKQRSVSVSALIQNDIVALGFFEPKANILAVKHSVLKLTGQSIFSQHAFLQDDRRGTDEVEELPNNATMHDAQQLSGSRELQLDFVIVLSTSPSADAVVAELSDDSNRTSDTIEYAEGAVWVPAHPDWLVTINSSQDPQRCSRYRQANSLLKITNVRTGATLSEFQGRPEDDSALLRLTAVS
jgi:hypothetical protein